MTGPNAVVDNAVAPAGAAVLTAAGISAGYNGGAVVRDIDLEVRPGEVVALLGRNGAGKTTTLRALSGLIRPLAGSVTVGGIATTGSLQSRARAGLGLVPDDKGLFFSLTVNENLRLGSGPVAEALRLFPELESRLNIRSGLLSGGEQQMLALGRALAARPKVLLADELSIGLAPMVVQRLLDAVRSAADAGTGVLLVEQHAKLALSRADRAYVLQNGRIVLTGAARDLAANLGELERAYLATPEADAEAALGRP
jgi:branched-chain amino acid transport system ATP-binding protein